MVYHEKYMHQKVPEGLEKKQEHLLAKGGLDSAGRHDLPAGRCRTAAQTIVNLRIDPPTSL